MLVDPYPGARNSHRPTLSRVEPYMYGEPHMALDDLVAKRTPLGLRVLAKDLEIVEVDRVLVGAHFRSRVRWCA